MRIQAVTLHILLLGAVSFGQQIEVQGPEQTNATTNLTNPYPTPKPHEITTSVTTPQHYKNTGHYSTLSQELQEFTHSRINADLRPGHDIMQIMLELLQWNDQDVEQMWVRPADHVDQAKYDDTTPGGLEISIQDVLRKIRFATLEELFDHYTYQKPVAKAIAIRQQVQPVVQQLVSSERVIEKDGVYHPSFKQPGKYKLDFSGEVNILRHAMLRMLQEHPGIAHADLDEHFISTHQPAWYETRVFPGT